MINLNSGKLKLSLLILFVLIGLGLFTVRSMYTSQKLIQAEKYQYHHQGSSTFAKSQQ